MPFNAPEKYWDIYTKKEIALAANDFFPKDAPSEAMFNWGELRAYYSIPQKGPLPDTLAYDLIHGYYACVSYVDAQIGRVIDALVELVDVYPTLCELAGLDLPFHLQGKSFASLLDDPEQPWKEGIFFRRAGETILTKTHTYTEWIDYETGKPYARMLYDLHEDPEENINISELSENKQLIETLHHKLHNHIKDRDEINIR